MLNLKIYETAAVLEEENQFRVLYISVSTVDWITIDDKYLYLPLNSAAAELIRMNMNDGKEVTIAKEWNTVANEVMPTQLMVNSTTNIDGYKRRASSYIKRFIHPLMANINASIIYGFNVINNKFLEAGVVFSEEDRSLKYIEVMEKADALEEEGKPEIADSLMALLERYIEYREVLDRSYFAWDFSEDTIKKIEEIEPEFNLITDSYNLELTEITLEADENLFDYVHKMKLAYFKHDDIEYVLLPDKIVTTEEFFTGDITLKDLNVNILNQNCIVATKKKIDKIVKDFSIKINTLNNLK